MSKNERKVPVGIPMWASKKDCPICGNTGSVLMVSGNRRLGKGESFSGFMPKHCPWCDRKKGETSDGMVSILYEAEAG